MTVYYHRKAKPITKTGSETTGDIKIDNHYTLIDVGTISYQHTTIYTVTEHKMSAPFVYSLESSSRQS